MKTQTLLLLTFLLVTSACQPTTPPPTPPAPVTVFAATATPAPPTVTPAPEASLTPTSNRRAMFAIIENRVEARPQPAANFAPASVGDILLVGGAARTGEDSRARLDLTPEGTIVRLAPNTIFNVTELAEKQNQPSTLLELLIGQIYIILNGGELSVQTPAGVAAVQGSMLGVYYNPAQNILTATCLEGHCSLSDGKTSLALTEGQAADIRDGILSHEPRRITDAELDGWLETAPELKELLDQLPSLRDRIQQATLPPPIQIIKTKFSLPTKRPRLPK